MFNIASQYTRCYYSLLVQQMVRTPSHSPSNLYSVRFFVPLQWMKMLGCDVSLIGITISINSSMQVMRMNMESVKLQLELGPKAITVRSSLWEGVLASKTFEGHKCYTQFLDFIKQAYPGEKFISAIIAVSNKDWWFTVLIYQGLSLQPIYMYDKSWYISKWTRSTGTERASPPGVRIAVRFSM